MYLQTTKERTRAYSNGWHEFFGTINVCVGSIEQTFDHYACDHCGRKSKCLRIDDTMPTEPFYCSDCNRLISVEVPQ